MKRFLSPLIKRSNSFSAGKTLHSLTYFFIAALLVSVGIAAISTPLQIQKPLHASFSEASAPASGSLATYAFLDKNGSDLCGENATIHFYLPAEAKSASISVSNASGLIIKSFQINNRGEGQLNISGNEMRSGNYRCSLVVNEKTVDSISWILIR